jgi:hypothetical protein
LCGDSSCVSAAWFTSLLSCLKHGLSCGVTWVWRAFCASHGVTCGWYMLLVSDKTRATQCVCFVLASVFSGDVLSHGETV